jgi:hypothetical protein
MKLYIETENNLPKNHPALEENLLQAFGGIPEHWVTFERVERPELGIYEEFDSDDPKYHLVDGIYKDIWMMRPMDEAEKTIKQQKVKDAWASLPNRENFTAWVFNENSCSYVPPIPMPETGIYKWNGEINNWEEIPAPTEI